MQISLRPEARIDIYDASRFYDRQSDGLGDKFIESIFCDLDRLERLAEYTRDAVGTSESFRKSSRTRSAKISAETRSLWWLF